MENQTNGAFEEWPTQVSVKFKKIIIEWFELEETFKDHLVQSPCHEQGHLSLDQVVQSPIQPELEQFQ